MLLRMLLLAAMVAGCRSSSTCETRDLSDLTPVQMLVEQPRVSGLQFQGEAPKNLLFISVDTLRKDHVGPYGGGCLTPFINEIAEQSVVMVNHQQCANWTTPGMTCTLAGRSNVEAGFFLRVGDAIPDNTALLPGWLNEAGYLTVVSTANDFFSERKGNTNGYQIEAHAFGGTALEVSDKGIDRLSSAIDAGHDGPWFLHLHSFEPHEAYSPLKRYTEGEADLEPWPDDLREREILNEWFGKYDALPASDQALFREHLAVLYQGDVRMWDDRIGKSWQDLQRAGLLEDTLVVFWNDHGEQFYDHGFPVHASQLYGEENDGMLMFWAENIVPGVYEAPTHAIDLVPTVLSVLNVPIPDTVTGVVVGRAAVDRPLFAESNSWRGVVQSVTLDGVKMHYSWRLEAAKVFDRNVDPGETVDLFDANDPVTQKLWALLDPRIDLVQSVLGGNRRRPVPPEGLQ